MKTKFIPLNYGGEVVDLAAVDECDYAQLMVCPWNLVISREGIRYARRGERVHGIYYHIFMHQIVMAMMLDLGPTNYTIRGVDHKDWDGLNNRRGNLRQATTSQNASNKKKTRDNSTGYKGVAIFHDRFRARIARHGKTYYLGVYHTAKEAAYVYDKAAIRLHGEFAVLNFPDVPNSTKEK